MNAFPRHLPIHFRLLACFPFGKLIKTELQRTQISIQQHINLGVNNLRSFFLNICEELKLQLLHI